jgi:hypothetical protein
MLAWSHSFQLKQVSQRHPAVIHGVLDDDRAPQCDDSEDWVEICAGLAREFQTVPTPWTIHLLPKRHPTFASSPPPEAAAMHRLCRFPC